MLKAAISDAEEGIIDEAFVIAHRTNEDGDMTTFCMGQSSSDMVFDMERAKLYFLTDATNFIPYEDEKD